MRVLLWIRAALSVLFCAIGAGLLIQAATNGEFALFFHQLSPQWFVFNPDGSYVGAVGEETVLLISVRPIAGIAVLAAGVKLMPEYAQ